mgnify:CR=1 FL=1
MSNKKTRDIWAMERTLPDPLQHCITCAHEPEWEEDKDIFNACEHCSKHTVGFCKKVDDFMKAIPGHKWPTPFSFDRLELCRHEKKPEHMIKIYDKRHPTLVYECPAWEPKEGLE